MFQLSKTFQFLQDWKDLLLLWLVSLGTTLGTRPRCCTPIGDFQTRADIRIRVRSIVIRIRIRHTAIRVRIVVPAIDHTACGKLYRLQSYSLTGRKKNFAQTKRQKMEATSAPAMVTAQSVQSHLLP